MSDIVLIKFNDKYISKNNDGTLILSSSEQLTFKKSINDIYISLITLDGKFIDYDLNTRKLFLNSDVSNIKKLKYINNNLFFEDGTQILSDGTNLIFDYKNLGFYAYHIINKLGYTSLGYFVDNLLNKHPEIRLMKLSELNEIYNMGAEWCSAGFLIDSIPAYPMQTTQPGCGAKGINFYNSEYANLNVVSNGKLTLQENFTVIGEYKLSLKNFVPNCEISNVINSEINNLNSDVNLTNIIAIQTVDGYINVGNETFAADPKYSDINSYISNNADYLVFNKINNNDGTFKLKTLDGKYINYVATWQIVLADSGADILYENNKIRFVNGPYWSKNNQLIRTHKMPFNNTDADINDAMYVRIIDTTAPTDIKINIEPINIQVNQQTNNNEKISIKCNNGLYFGFGNELYAADSKYPDINQYLSLVDVNSPNKLYFTKENVDNTSFKLRTLSGNYILRTENTWQIVLSPSNSSNMKLDDNNRLCFSDGVYFTSPDGKVLRTHALTQVSNQYVPANNTSPLIVNIITENLSSDDKILKVQNNVSSTNNALNEAKILDMSVLTNNTNWIISNSTELVARAPNACSWGTGACNDNDCITQKGPGWKWIGVTGEWYNLIYYTYSMCMNTNNFNILKQKINEIHDNLNVINDKFNKLIGITTNSINDTITTVSKLKDDITKQISDYQNLSSQLKSNIDKINNDANVLMQNINKDYLKKMEIIQTAIKQASEIYKNKLKDIETKFSDLIDILNKSTDEIIKNMENNINQLKTNLNTLNTELEMAKENYTKKLQDLQNENEIEITKLKDEHKIETDKLNVEIQNTNEQIKIEQQKLEDAKKVYANDIQVAKESYDATILKLKDDNKKAIDIINDNYTKLKTQYDNDIAEYTALLKQQDIEKHKLIDVLNELGKSIEANKLKIQNAEKDTQNQITNLNLEFDKQLNLIEENTTKINTDYDNLKQQKINEYNQLLTELRNKEISLVSAQKDTALSELQNIFNQITSAQEEYNIKQDEYSKNISNLQNKISDLQNKIAGLNNELESTIKNLNDDQKKQILVLLNEFSNEQKDAINKAVESSKIIYDQLQKDISNLQTNKNELIDAIKNYQKQRDAIENEYNETRDKLLGDTTKYISDIIKDYTDVNNAREIAQKITLDKFLDDQLNEKKKTLETLQKSYDILQKNKEELQKNIDTIKTIQNENIVENSYLLYYIIGGISLGLLVYFIYYKRSF